MLLLVAFGVAHPFGHTAGPAGPAVLGQRLTLAVGRDEVTVELVAELPKRRLLEEGSAEVGATVLLGVLPDAVHLAWEGAAIPVQWEPGSIRPGESGFTDLVVVGRAPLPTGEGTLRARNGAFPDEPCFFQNTVTVDGSRVARASSVARVHEGRVRDNQNGAWVKDEGAREPWVTLRPARPWERSADPAPLTERLEGAPALEPPWELGVAALLGCLGLGGATWALWRRRARDAGRSVR